MAPLKRVHVSAGDVIGACFNRAAGTIAYYKNGMWLGVAFDGIREERMYPCVGMRTKDEEVCPVALSRNPIHMS